MSNVLLITSSLSGESAVSRKVANELVEGLRPRAASVRERHLTPENMPHIDMAALAAGGTPAEKRSAAQNRAAALSDEIIAEVEAVDTVVIAAPMYNFTIPSTLKAWLDHLARAGRTFRYTENGPVGLLCGKKVYVVLSRGGFYGEGSAGAAVNFQEPYLRTIFGFVGITDITFVSVEGQAVGPAPAAEGLAKARAAVAALTSFAVAA